MPSNKVKLTELGDALSAILDDYSTALRDAINEETENAANNLKKGISADAPVGTGKKKGKQKKSWRVAKDTLNGITTVCTVYSTDYPKVHLLEDGHLTRDGRTRTKAFHYVRNNTERVEKEYIEAIGKIIKEMK